MRGALTGGTSLALELKLLAAGALLVIALFFGLCVVLVMRRANAQTLTEGGVMPTCRRLEGADAPPERLIPIYERAAARYRLGDDGWSVLAAINRIETNFGQDTSDSSAKARGWMQFLDSTWAAYGVDADGVGGRDQHDPDDAIHGAANYLKASGAPRDWYRAIFAYNHADWYVQDVLQHAETYRGACPSQTYAPPATTPGVTGKLRSDGTVLAPQDAPEQVKRIIAAANRIANLPYLWGGGHSGWSAAGYDCSGLVSYALHGAGYLDGAMTSGGFETWGDPGPGTWVTVYANYEHVFMVVAGLRLDTGGGDRRGSAWRAPSLTRSRSYSGFVVRHPPGL